MYQMKNMRKIATLLLALALILSLAAPVFAAEDTYTITIKNDVDGHIYEAYQIFVGDLAKEAENDEVDSTEAVLSNIRWGANANQEGEVEQKILDELSIEKAISYVNFDTDPVATSTDEGDTYVIEGLAPGYYLIKDQDGSVTGNDAYTAYIIEVVEDSTVAPKSDVPEVQKKVKDTNDTDGTTTDWQDSADYDIGDAVPFQLKATLANNVSAYKTYKIVFHDTLSAGLTFKAVTKVTVDGVEITEGYEVNTVVNEDGTTTLTITFDNVKAQDATDSSVVIVEYTAELNEDAVIGAAGNPNVVYLEFSNNPNWVPDENPDTPDEPDTGKTPEDKVIVFTYQAIVNKVDEKNEALKGAGFTLYKEVDGEWVQISEELVGGDLTKFTWTGLDDGNYKLAETTTPAGYNTVDDIYFTIEATHDVESADPKLTELVVKDVEGNVISEGETASFTATAVAGTVETTVVNQSGATLPETGGIGTTIFYAVGAIMVLGAVVLLVTKKRMAA